MMLGNQYGAAIQSFLKDRPQSPPAQVVPSTPIGGSMGGAVGSAFGRLLGGAYPDAYQPQPAPTPRPEGRFMTPWTPHGPLGF